MSRPVPPKKGPVNKEQSSSSGHDLDSNQIQVVVRFRPLNLEEKGAKKEGLTPKNTEKNTELCWRTINNSITYIDLAPGPNRDMRRSEVEPKLSAKKESHTFNFDQTYSDIGQTELFTAVGLPVVDWVCQGYNASIFAYGATSSGKTYTMFGTPTAPGLIPRACEELFQRINKDENVVEADMKCSFIEIYREQLQDLLRRDSEDCPPLRIRQGPQGVYIQGLIEKHVYSSTEVMENINKGMTIRSTASTALNSQSSRSHAILTLTLRQKLVDNTEITSKLNMIDLAGSENVFRSEAQGVTLQEAQMINKSLSCLANVIYALTEKNREHVPYRDSKLTYLLQDSLGGNAKTVLIATINPSTICYSETLNTLKFATRVKQIVNVPRINKVVSTEQTISDLQAQVVSLQEALQEALQAKGSVELTQQINETHTEQKKLIEQLWNYNVKCQLKCDQLTDRLAALNREYHLVCADKNFYASLLATICKNPDTSAYRISQLHQMKVIKNLIDS
jgi:kinesin family protein 11